MNYWGNGQAIVFYVDILYLQAYNIVNCNLYYKQWLRYNFLPKRVF